MGNKHTCNGNKSRKSDIQSNSNNPLTQSVKYFLKSKRNGIDFNLKEKKLIPVSVVKKKSGLKNLLDSSEVQILSQEILTNFSNKEIAKINNQNFYVSLLMLNLFESVGESKLNNSNNVNMSVVQNNLPMYFTTTTVEKINEIFNLNNEQNTNEKSNKYKMSMNSINYTNRDLLGLSLQNLNMSRDSHLETDTNNLNAANLSRLNTKKSRLTTVFTRRSSKDILEEENRSSLKLSLKPRKSLSNKSVKFVNTQTENDLFKKKASLNQIKEFEMELQDDNHEKSTERSFHSSRADFRKNNKLKAKTIKNKSVDSRVAKKLKYSTALRDKIKTRRGSSKNIDKTRSASRSPFDLFSDKVLEHFRNEEKIIETKVTSPLVHKKKKENKEKKKIQFSLNLKEIIKQEMRENMFNGKLKYKIPTSKNKMDNINSLHFNSINNSTLFKDSIDKLIHFENSIYNQKTNAVGNNGIKPDNKMNGGKITPEMLSKISLSEDKEIHQNSNIEISHETINRNLALLKKH